MIKVKKRHIFHIRIFNMVGQCFEWIKDTSQFNEGFMKTVMKEVMKTEKPKSLQLIYMIKLNMLYTSEI